MYIPLHPQALVDASGFTPASLVQWGSTRHEAEDELIKHGLHPNLAVLFHRLEGVFSTNARSTRVSTPELRRRDGVEQQNITIGVIVGVLLAVFLVAAFFFLYRYRYTVQFTYKKKHRRRSGTGSSKSSKTSASSASSEQAPAG